MESSLSQVKRQRIGFLLLDNFTMLALGSAIDPIRMANQLTSQQLYEWITFSQDGAPVTSSDGLAISVDHNLSEIPVLDTIIVVGGIDITNSYTNSQLFWLKKLCNNGVQVGGICTGAYVLAAAGLMDNRECSVHWECAASLQETYPKVVNNNHLYTITKDRMTSSGGIAPLDMMLSMIQKQHGSKLAAAISDMFSHDKVRTSDDYQRVPMRPNMAIAQPKLIELITLMENNLEEPINLNELAAYINISRRQLERLFQKYFNCTPSRYYMRLRLERARQLLKQTSMPIIEIATACGFVSTPHFSKCYSDYTGNPPRDERSNNQIKLSDYRSNHREKLKRSLGASATPKSAACEPSYGSVCIEVDERQVV
ncbi:MAG: GlxA family transcriptional regulator [Reinekea sp.]|jgi:AraC family transcriptional regulator, glycine betaine-responsive activator